MPPAEESDTSREGDVVAFELWRLPGDFFSLEPEAQWEAFARITVQPKKVSQPRQACELTFSEDLTVSAFLLVILGVPLLIPGVFLLLLAMGSTYLKWFVAVVLVLAFHPIPKYKASHRRSRIGVLLAKYFTATVLLRREAPGFEHAGTAEIDRNPPRAPVVALACPHGVLNFGAIIWVFFSRWICGREQYTAGVSAVQMVPGLRYLVAPLWVIRVDRKSLKRRLQEEPQILDADGKPSSTRALRRGGMIGIVPDGIAGIFRSKPGEDVLFIGKKRGLMRICLEEGAMIMGGWFSGTSDLFHIVVDPLGIMEWISRKMQVSLFLFFGRWGLPIPRRISVTLCAHVVQAEKKAAPTEEEVEALHQTVYGGMSRAFEEMRHFAGYPERRLVVL